MVVDSRLKRSAQAFNDIVSHGLRPPSASALAFKGPALSFSEAGFLLNGRRFVFKELQCDSVAVGPRLRSPNLVERPLVLASGANILVKRPLVLV